MVGERIRRARLAKGLSLEKLAVKTGQISKQAIHKYEQEKAVPSSAVLIRLAAALDVKPEYFFRPIEVKLEKINFRRKSRLLVGEQKAIEETARDQLERYLLLEDVFPPDELQRPEFKPLPITINKPEDAELAAVKVREQWNLGVDPIENMTELLEERGIKVVEVEAGEQFDGLSGLVDGKHAVIVIQRDWPGERQRFTMAHELGHLILKISPVCLAKERERCCHRFAAALLVPRTAALLELGQKRRNLDFRELVLLKEKYGLSIQAWVYRAFDLDIISHSLFTRIFKEMSRLHLRKQEPCRLDAEKPTRFKRLLLHALAENIISETKASDLLGVRTDELRPTIEKWAPWQTNA